MVLSYVFQVGEGYNPLILTVKPNGTSPPRPRRWHVHPKNASHVEVPRPATNKQSRRIWWSFETRPFLSLILSLIVCWLVCLVGLFVCLLVCLLVCLFGWLFLCLPGGFEHWEYVYVSEIKDDDVTYFPCGWIKVDGEFMRTPKSCPTHTIPCMVYLLTFSWFLWDQCRYMYRSSHGCYGQASCGPSSGQKSALILLMVQKSGESPVYMVNIPFFTFGSIHPRWLLGFLPSIVGVYVAKSMYILYI